MAKLTCKIPRDLAAVIDRYQIEYNVKKSEALKRFVEMAIDKPDFHMPDISDSEDINCTISMSDGDLERYRQYRLKHMLVPKVSFFKDALIRGISIYSTDHGQGDLDFKG